MTKPWDNELTPLVDSFSPYQLAIEEAQNLEQRLRYAEALLFEALPHIQSPDVAQRTLVHLQAARVDDAG